MPVYLIIHVIA